MDVEKVENILINITLAIESSPVQTATDAVVLIEHALTGARVMTCFWTTFKDDTDMTSECITVL